MTIELPAGEAYAARIRELDRKFATPGSKVVMGPHVVVRESDESNLRVERQDVEIWSNEEKIGTARFTTYRCRETGKALITNIDSVEDEGEI